MASDKKLHAIGIGGIGVSAVARFFRARGWEVVGTDVSTSEVTDSLEQLGIRVVAGHHPELITKSTNLVVYSAAVPEDDPERIRARNLEIQSLAYPEALSLMMEDHFGIAISGTNGKTTTTAILGILLETAGLDPTVVVGGSVSAWKGNLRLGRGDTFVAEACEYRRHMMKLSPQMIVLTNIEADHLDYYQDLADIESAFTDYVKKLGEEDVLVFNADDPVLRRVVRESKARLIAYGADKQSMVQLTATQTIGGMQYISANVLGMPTTFETVLPGRYNAYNILAAVSAAVALGIKPDKVRAGVAAFQGSWRRFEQVGTFTGHPVISDYAHHPTAVRGALGAARERYPKGKVLAVFQPHQENRTRMLFDEFIESFAGADTLIIEEIYEVAGREQDGHRVSSKDLIREVRERGGVGEVLYAKDGEAVLKLVKRLAPMHNVILFMGAGDIDRAARDLAHGV